MTNNVNSVNGQSSQHTDKKRVGSTKKEWKKTLETKHSD